MNTLNIGNIGYYMTLNLLGVTFVNDNAECTVSITDKGQLLLQTTYVPNLFGVSRLLGLEEDIYHVILYISESHKRVPEHKRHINVSDVIHTCIKRPRTNGGPVRTLIDDYRELISQ